MPRPMRLTLKFAPPLIFLAIGFLFVLVAHGYERALERLLENSQPATATVVSKRSEVSQGGESTKNVRPKHLVTYRLVAEGTTIERTASFEKALFDALDEGDSLAVTYRAGEPALHRFDDSGVLVSGETQFSPAADTISLWIATALAVLAVLWVLFAPRLILRE